MKTVTVDQMRIMDTYAPLYGKDEQTLMENAASAIVQEAVSYGRILFFCGCPPSFTFGEMRYRCV